MIAPRRVKITDDTGVWFSTASFAPPHLHGERLGQWLTKLAAHRGIRATYEPATEQDYQAYKARQRGEIEK